MTPADLFIITTTGARFHKNAGFIITKLYEAIGQTDAREIRIRHGACPGGADLIVAEFCDSEAAWFDNAGRALVEEPMPADWDHCAPDCPKKPHRVMKKPGDIFHPGALPDYCPGAGPRRNTAMVCRQPRANVCLGFPLGASYGTRGCMRLARAAGIDTRPLVP